MNFNRSRNFDCCQIVARLIYNALRFRLNKIRGSPLKPSAVSLAVTNRCNSHCIMCNIWKSAGDNPEMKGVELSGRRIIDILKSPMFSGLVELDLTGGEPHLRDDLVDIVHRIVHIKRKSLPGLRSIIITSNGFLTRRILSNYREMLLTLKGMDIDLVTVISLDGIGDIHDRIRGTKGAFKLVSKTLKGLLELKKEYPNLIPGIKTTILPQNIDALDSILNFALSNNLFHIISPAIFTESRFKNMDKKPLITMAASGNQKLLDFYLRDELKNSYFYARGLDYLLTGKKQWICAASFNYLFIDYDGKVYPCELIPEAIGDVKNQNIMDIWNSSLARNWRKRIGKLEYCRLCHEPGTIRYSAIVEGMSYLKYLIGLGRRKYFKSLEGEGYFKYLSRQVKQ